MQYVRNFSNTAWTTWNSLNPATLSGAIDVIVVEQEDGSLCCSPFHVRFGKFSLLRPFEKKVQFTVNGVKQDHPMKLGEGGEAFFVFETNAAVPDNLQTSPLASPTASPVLTPSCEAMPDLEPLDLNNDTKSPPQTHAKRPPNAVLQSPALLSRNASPPVPVTSSPALVAGRPVSEDWRKLLRPMSDYAVPQVGELESGKPHKSPGTPPPKSGGSHELVVRAMALSRELSAANILSEVTEDGDLKLDMASFKATDEDPWKAELLARKILSQELEGHHNIGALFGMDEDGNLWIYSSEEAKDAAMKNVARHSSAIVDDAASDPGYQSDSSEHTTDVVRNRGRAESDCGMDMQTPPQSPPPVRNKGGPSRTFAKTLRLTSDQLKFLNLKAGENSMSFTVNRSTCHANMYLWKHSTPVVISDIDGTITKSDAMGHVMNMIGRDWTHEGVAKLYCDIAANGYNIMYLTSRSVGQSDTTRAYLHNIRQNGYRLPRGPTILSPDRTIAALRREIYLRKPHVFKMATLRDIRNLYGAERTPFYAGFGNRLTDQISYRTVDVPSHRIFTINSNAEVSLDLLSLNKLKLSYVNMTDIVDHYFPPVSALITTKGGGDEFTDFKYWRNDPLALDQFSASESGEDQEGPMRVDEDDYDLEDEQEDAIDGVDHDEHEEGEFGEEYGSDDDYDADDDNNDNEPVQRHLQEEDEKINKKKS